MQGHAVGRHELRNYDMSGIPLTKYVVEEGEPPPTLHTIHTLVGSSNDLLPEASISQQARKNFYFFKLQLLSRIECLLSLFLISSELGSTYLVSKYYI